MCVHVCRHMCMEVWGHICAPVCRGHRTILGMTPQQWCLLYCEDTDFFLAWNLPHRLGWQASEPRETACPGLSSIGVIGTLHHMWFCFWRTHSGPPCKHLPTFCPAQASNLDFYCCLVLCFPFETCFLVFMCVYMFIHVCGIGVHVHAVQVCVGTDH